MLVRNSCKNRFGQCAQVRWGEVSENNQGEVRGVLARLMSDLVPTCICILCGRRVQQRNNGTCRYFSLRERAVPLALALKPDNLVSSCMFLVFWEL